MPPPAFEERAETLRVVHPKQRSSPRPRLRHPQALGRPGSAQRPSGASAAPGCPRDPTFARAEHAPPACVSLGWSSSGRCRLSEQAGPESADDRHDRPATTTTRAGRTAHESADATPAQSGFVAAMPVSRARAESPRSAPVRRTGNGDAPRL